MNSAAVLIFTALSFAFPTQSRSADVYEACRTMTAKLSGQSQLMYWRDFERKWAYVKDPVASAELIVFIAYNLPREELEAKWPGFFDWSVVAVLKAWRQGLSPEEFKASAYVDCVAEYSE